MDKLGPIKQQEIRTLAREMIAAHDEHVAWARGALTEVARRLRVVEGVLEEVPGVRVRDVVNLVNEEPLSAAPREDWNTLKLAFSLKVAAEKVSADPVVVAWREYELRERDFYRGSSYEVDEQRRPIDPAQKARADAVVQAWRDAWRAFVAMVREGGQAR